MKRILVFNWRDIKNPYAGGAEEYVHQIFSRLSKKGYAVTLCTSTFHRSKSEEVVDGVNVIRLGNKFLLYFMVPIYYLLNRKKFDFVVESINTIPFFTPIFVRKKRLAIVHHLAGVETYRLQVGRLLSLLLECIQNNISRLYRDTFIITVSKSSQSELIEKGTEPRNIAIVPNGVTRFEGSIDVKKSTKPTVIYVGRVNKIKRVEEILYAVKDAQKDLPDLTLIIGGRGEEEYYRHLDLLAKKIGLNNTLFLGPLTEEQKFNYLKKSWLYLITSVKEGWGNSVIEANCVGLPVIGYAVPGITDSVLDGHNGVLVKDLDRTAYKEAIKRLIVDSEFRMKISINAIEYSESFTWDSSAEHFLNIMNEI